MTSPGRDGRPRSRAERLSAMLEAMRDVHIALRELQAAEARLFELVDMSARLELDELAAEVALERDPLTPGLEAEKLATNPYGSRRAPHLSDS